MTNYSVTLTYETVHSEYPNAVKRMSNYPSENVMHRKLN